ncbi:hypothetical protein Tco_0917324, partial [Tanacetum coccineum]
MVLPSEKLLKSQRKYLLILLKSSRPGTRGSSEGTSIKPGVPDEENLTYEEKVILEWGSEQESEYSEEDQSWDEEIDWIDSKEDDEKKDDTDDDKSINIEMTDDEETDDAFVQSEEQVNDDEDEEMKNAEVEESGNDDEEDSDAAKAEVEKTEEVKDVAKKAELPPTSSSLSVSSGFSDQFLKLCFDTSLIGTIKDTIDVEINSLLDIKIQSEVLHIQSPSLLKVSVFVIPKPLVLTPVQESPSVTPVTTLPPPSISTIPPVPHQTTTPIPTPPITTNAPTITTVVSESDALSVVQLRVVKLEYDVSKLKKIDHSAKALATLKSKVPMVIDNYLGSKFGDIPIVDLKQESEKSPSEIHKIKREQAKKQKMLKYTIKSTDKAVLKEYDQKSALYMTMHENKSFNINPANHALYHDLMEALIEDENAIDKGVANTLKNHKRQHDDVDDDDDDEDPSAIPNQ